uniref:Uncharacterized protein n=1 Tax=Anguilla anguilla TaxID=7936 RepID=A0A0E9PHA0_ANGAN
MGIWDLKCKPANCLTITVCSTAPILPVLSDSFACL